MATNKTSKQTFIMEDIQEKYNHRNCFYMRTA